MNRVIGIIVIVILGAVLFRSCAFVVDQRNYAIVFTLGQLKAVVSEPGLHWKWPIIDRVDYLEKRILTIDTPTPDRVQTSEKKNLLIDSFVKWRILDARRYWVSFRLGGERAAQERINSLVRDALNQAVNKRTVNDVTSRERDKAMDEIKLAVQERVKEFGVEIVDVRLKRVDFVPEISESVYRRMEAERKRVANEQRSIGSAEGEKIRADADRQREVLLAEAFRDAQKIKGQGDAKAAALYAQSFGQNAEFAAFYRSLEAYRASFHNRSDFIIVDPSSEFFRYMKSPNAQRGAPR